MFKPKILPLKKGQYLIVCPNGDIFIDYKGRCKELLAFALAIANDMSNIYNKGFEDCISELDKIDANFLSRNKPPHLK